jgi:hypothetical protein
MLYHDLAGFPLTHLLLIKKTRLSSQAIMNYTPEHPPTQAAAAAAFYGYEDQRAVASEPYAGYGGDYHNHYHARQPAASFEHGNHGHSSPHSPYHPHDEAMIRPKLSRETPSCFGSSNPMMTGASRKQKRGFARRNGQVHSELLKSAVLASMSSHHTRNSASTSNDADHDMMMMDEEEEDEEEEDNASISWGSSSQHTVPELHLPLPPPQQSPRKRVRRNGMAVEEESSDLEADHELAIAHASNLLESLCNLNSLSLSRSFSGGGGGRGSGIARNSSSSRGSSVGSGSTAAASGGAASAAAGAAAGAAALRSSEDGAPARRQAPVRRVSRRTSYESVISGCNSEDFDEDLM